ENAKKLNELADDKTRKRMDDLSKGYELAAGRSLSAMVEANMSGTSREEARARVTQQGVITNYQKLRFSIEGLGTDMPMLRGTVAGMSKDELQKADEQWRKDHDGESLIEAIKGDTSGREQDDLVDMATYGAPQNVDQLVEAARRKFENDRANERYSIG